MDPMNLSLELMVELGYALGIGVLIGLERTVGTQSAAAAASGAQGPGEALEASSNGTAPEPYDEYMGVRTFAVLALFGFASALIGDRYALAVPVALLAATAVVVAMYFRARHLGVGITTEVAAMASCGLGVLAHGAPHMAGVLGLVVTVLLSSKRWTHEVARRMRRIELTDTLKFLVIILILLPLMPNRALDPYGAFNPYKVTFLVVLISGIGYVGYFLTRLLGAQRGLGLTGLIGGLTSSTAVTAAMAAQARAEPALESACAFATVAANATMFARVLVVVALLDYALMLHLAWAIGTMAAVAIAAASILWASSGKRQAQTEGGRVELKNPFSVGPALKFAAFFVVILLVARLSREWLGDSGLYLAALVSGLADVDAITLSIAEQASRETLAREVGAIGITIAVVSNSLVKSGIAWYSGGWRFGRLVGLCLLLATGAGLGVIVLV